MPTLFRNRKQSTTVFWEVVDADVDAVEPHYFNALAQCRPGEPEHAYGRVSKGCG